MNIFCILGIQRLITIVITQKIYSCSYCVPDTVENFTYIIIYLLSQQQYEINAVIIPSIIKKYWGKVGAE